MFTVPLYVGIILRKEDQVLLVKRHNTQWANGQWNFPGGLVEKGETLIQAAVREIYEEVGVAVLASNFELVHVLSVHDNTSTNSNTISIVGVYFMAIKWEGIVVNKEPHRHTDIEWFPVHAMPTESTNHAQQALNGMLAEVLYSED